MKSLFTALILILLIIPGNVSGTTPAEEHEAFLKSLPVKGKVTMIALGKKTCTQCKMMAPILEKLKIKYEGKAAIVFINLIEDPEQQYVYNLKAIPAQIFFNTQGEEIFRHTGFFAEKAIVEQLTKMGVE